MWISFQDFIDSLCVCVSNPMISVTRSSPSQMAAEPTAVGCSLKHEPKWLQSLLFPKFVALIRAASSVFHLTAISICHQGAIDLLLSGFCAENFESDVRIRKQKVKFVPRMNLVFYTKFINPHYL